MQAFHLKLVTLLTVTFGHFCRPQIAGIAGQVYTFLALRVLLFFAEAESRSLRAEECPEMAMSQKKGWESPV